MKKNTQAKTWLMVLGLSAIVVTASGCLIHPADLDDLGNSEPKLHGSGNLVIVEPDLGTFTRVEFAESIEAIIVQGDENHVSIQIDDNLEEHLVATTSGDTLIVTLDDGYDYTDETVIASVTMPSLISIHAEEDVSVRFSGFEFDGPLDLTVNDESSVQGTSPMTFQNLSIDVYEDSTVSLAGDAESVNLVATDECSVDMRNTTTRSANVVLDEESAATITVTDMLSYDLNDESVLTYYGNPTLGSTRVSDESNVIHLSAN